MTRKFQIFSDAPAAGVGLLFLGVTTAQPPRGRDDKRGPGDRKGPDAPAKADPAVEAWVKTLTEKLTDKNDAVRDSARAALVQVGPAALPVLKKLADGKDEALATAAKSV